MIKEFILKQSFEKKIELLESAFDEGFGMFWQVAEILLQAPCGEGGGLPTETIDKVFKNKLKEKK